MKRALYSCAILSCVILFVAFLSYGQGPLRRPPQAPPPGGPGMGPVGALPPGAPGRPDMRPRMERPGLSIDWWYDREYAVPHNGQQLSDAIRREERRLKPGESERFKIVADGPENRPRFVKLLPEEGSELLQRGQRVVGLVTITVDRFSRRPDRPMEPPKQEDFEAWRRGYTRGAVDFDDFAAVSKALVQLAGGGGFINLLKQEVYAPFDGTVILVAQDRAPDYEVFDVAANRKDPQRYRKGESVRTLGTTVWVLSADKKYVGVFSQLGRSDATVGQRVTGGKTRIGECRDYKSRSFQLYRVYNPSQYFLNGSRGSQPIQLFPWADEDTTYSTAPQVWREPTRGW